MADELSESEARIIRLERLVHYLYGHFGLDASAADGMELPVPSEITALLSEGKNMAAVKEYRSQFDANLADATRAVKNLGG